MKRPVKNSKIRLELNQLRIQLQLIVIAILIIVGFNTKLSATNVTNENALNNFNKISNYYLEMNGILKQTKVAEFVTEIAIDRAEISIYDIEGKVLESSYSDKQGFCFFRLPLNSQFMLKISKSGLITKTINIDTRLSEEKQKKYRLSFEIEMFEDIKELDISMLKGSVADITYNEFLNNFDYNYKYTSAVNKKIKILYLNYYLSTKNNDSIQSKKDDIKPINDLNSNLVQDSADSIINNENADIDNSLVHENKNSIVYKIQILSLSNQASPLSPFFENCGKTQEYFHDGKYKYTIGEFKTLESASAMLDIIQKIGYKDAFTIAFLNKERISEEEAITIQNTTK